MQKYIVLFTPFRGDCPGVICLPFFCFFTYLASKGSLHLYSPIWFHIILFVILLYYHYWESGKMTAANFPWRGNCRVGVLVRIPTSISICRPGPIFVPSINGTPTPPFDHIFLIFCLHLIGAGGGGGRGSKLRTWIPLHLHIHARQSNFH